MRALRRNSQEYRGIRGRLASCLTERTSPRKQKDCTAKITFPDFSLEKDSTVSDAVYLLSGEESYPVVLIFWRKCKCKC